MYTLALGHRDNAHLLLQFLGHCCTHLAFLQCFFKIPMAYWHSIVYAPAVMATQD